jgi:porin
MKIGPGVLCLALLVSGANAAESPAAASTNSTAASLSATNATGFEKFWAQDKILGDWFGARTNLANRGITADLRLSQYWQGVASGGVQQRGEYGGTMDYIVNVDGDKLAGLKGFSMNMHARTRFGSDINSSAGSFVLPNAGMMMPLPGDYNGTDITGLTASQMFPLFDRPAVVSFGKLDLIDTLTELFPWIGYGQDGLWNVNGVFPVLPMLGPVQGLSLFGGMAVSINPEYGKPQTGFMITGTENVSTTWDFGGSFDEGVFMAGFYNFFWGNPKEKIGYITILGYGSTKDQASNDPHDFVPIPGQGITSTQSMKPWGVLGTVYQEFWHAADNPNRKANFVIGGSGGSDNPQFAQWSAFGNVEAHGLLAGRPADRLGVAGWYSGLSGNFTDLVSPVTDLRDTWGAELYYNIAINKWFHLTPDIQFVQNERAGDDLAVIIGLRTVLDF